MKTWVRRRLECWNFDAIGGIVFRFGLLVSLSFATDICQSNVICVIC
jgi:hypothetical protein